MLAKAIILKILNLVLTRFIKIKNSSFLFKIWANKQYLRDKKEKIKSLHIKFFFK